ncbi:hypothetical protein AN901_201935 [Pseudomonas syringae pv. theae]|nr:hypothetical protein AN901_201935 [Pseudomonas syringae pv. theae]
MRACRDHHLTGVRHVLLHRVHTLWRDPQPLEPRAQRRRFERRGCRTRRRAGSALCPRQRRRWLIESACVLLRRVRLQTQSRPDALRPDGRRRLGRPEHRARHHPDRPRQRSPARRHSRHGPRRALRRPGPEPVLRQRRPTRPRPPAHRAHRTIRHLANLARKPGRRTRSRTIVRVTRASHRTGQPARGIAGTPRPRLHHHWRQHPQPHRHARPHARL